MQCPHCQATLLYKERSGRKCSKCKRAFVLEPKVSPLNLHDLRVRRLAEKLGGRGTYRFTPSQLFHFAAKRPVGAQKPTPFGAMIGWLVFFVVLASVGVLKILPLVGALPRYALYPPPPRHPLLTAPQAIPLLLALGALIGLVLAARAALARLPGDAEGTADSAADRIAVLLFWLLVVSLAALADNPFGAVTFLALPESDRLVRSFVQLNDEAARRRIADLVEWLAAATAQARENKRSF